MQDHVVVCGLGEVGYRVVSLLHQLGEPVAVVALHPREAWVRELVLLGITVVQGDARDSDALLEAGLDRAKAVIAVTDQDLVNVQCALEAQELRGDLPAVVRLFDQHLGIRLESAMHLRRAADMAALAAPSFAAAALGEQVYGSIELGAQRFVLERVGLDPALAGRHGDVGRLAAIRQAVAVGYDDPDGVFHPAPPDTCPLEPGGRVTLLEPAAVALHPAPVPRPARRLRLALGVLGQFGEIWSQAPVTLRMALASLVTLILLSILVFSQGLHLSLVDALYYVVSTVTTTGYGDITPGSGGDGIKLFAVVVMLVGSVTVAVVYSMVTDFIVRSRFEGLLSRRRVPESGHVVVVGLGNLGFRVAETLHQAGTPLVVVDRDPANDFAGALVRNVHLVVGDARLEETLTKAGVQSADAVVAVTDDAAVNLGVALGARALNPNVRTVLRLFDADLARRMRAALAIDVVLSPSSIAAATFVAAALYPNVVRAFRLEDRLLAFVQHPVPDGWVGLTRAGVQSLDGVSVLLRRSSSAIRFEPLAVDACLESGDEVLASASRLYAGRAAVAEVTME